MGGRNIGARRDASSRGRQHHNNDNPGGEGHNARRRIRNVCYGAGGIHHQCRRACNRAVGSVRRHDGGARRRSVKPSRPANAIRHSNIGKYA